MSTPTKGPSTPTPGVTQPATDAVSPVPVNLPANSPRSIPKRATIAGGERLTGEIDAVVTEKHGKKWVNVHQIIFVIQAVMRVPSKIWYIRDQLGRRFYSNSEEGRYWSRLDAFLDIFPPDQLTAIFYMTSELSITKRYKPTKNERL